VSATALISRIRQHLFLPLILPEQDIRTDESGLNFFSSLTTIGTVRETKKITEKTKKWSAHMVEKTKYLPLPEIEHRQLFFFILFVRLLALRPLLAYCANLGR
jgi:hypothetical protein